MTYPKGYRFLNPYNFVRFLEAAEPKTAETALLGRCAPPPHDRYLGLTGRIMCTLEAVTPLFVSDTHGIEEDPQVREHKRYRFFQYGGQDAIPASTLRGVVRSVFEAVTNSCFASFHHDQEGNRCDRLEHRLSGDPGLVPARVIDMTDHGATLELLDCAVMGAPAFGRGPTVLKCGIVSAYNPCVLYNDHSTQVPFRRAGTVLKGYRGNKRVAALVNTHLVDHGTRYRYYKVEKIVPAQDHARLAAGAGQQKVFGYLHVTGPNIENKHDERLFFRWDDRQPEPRKSYKPQDVLIGSDVVRAYNRALAKYWERHHERVEELEKAKWPPTATALPFPSSFVRQNRSLRKGDLVYYLSEQDGSKYIFPVSMPRKEYRHPREKLLPQHLWRCREYANLCPACRVFGWVAAITDDQSKSDTDKITAYAGRVRFSHAMLTCDGDRGAMPPLTLGILSSPKPTTTPFYLYDPKQPSRLVDYDNPQAHLRGRKFYRNFGATRPAIYRLEANVSVSDKSDQNRTILGARRPGNQFQFTLDFENLAPVELGALLWSLELPFEGEQGCHRLGYAKPFGFGSAKITITALQILNPESRYTSLSEEGGWQPALAAKEGWINTFRDAMEHLYSRPFASLENVRDLTALLGEPPDKPIEYPHPPSTDAENFEWFVGNKRLGSRGYVLALADKDTDGLPLLNRRGEKW